MLRFLALALPAALLVLAAVDAGAAALGVGPVLTPLAELPCPGRPGPPAP